MLLVIAFVTVFPDALPSTFYTTRIVILQCNILETCPITWRRRRWLFFLLIIVTLFLFIIIFLCGLHILVTRA
ncbi:hypothetical protein BX600DRAFT_466007 [Xylariales sp. PMI_506]|nr:hypothetical protein BX600DRAFT_466007 [Xylariales sp. PMI_506]